MLGITYCNVAPAECENATFIAAPLISPPEWGYTSNVFALLLMIVIAIPATAVGNLTPEPADTTFTILIYLIIKKNKKWILIKAEIL